MKTVDGKVIRIKGNRREERSRRRKKLLIGLVYFVLTAMILVLCGVLIRWMVKPHEKSVPVIAPDYTEMAETENTDNPIEEEITVISEPAAESAAELEPAIRAQIQSLLADFKVIDASSSSGASVHPGKYTLLGRWYQTQIDGVWCNNTVTQGAMVLFKISGTDSFTIHFFNRTMMEMPFFAYSVDGGIMQRQSVADGHVTLPDYGEHTVCLVMDGISEREFKWSGEIGFAFSDIDCSTGTMSAYASDKKTILFLGDSVTEGIMTLGSESVSEYNSAVHSYSWYLAQNLNASPYFCGYGSTGITQTGSFNTMSSTLDYLSESRPIPEAEYPACDLVVLNTGTNDYNATDEQFYSGYKDLINKLHTRYPEVPIVCVIPFTQTHAAQIREAALQYDFVYAVETAEWEVTYSDEERIHPNDAGSQYIAGKLTDYIKQKNIF